MSAFPQNAQLKIDHNQPVPLDAIHAVAQRIVEKFTPEKIILFGSYANGNPQASSDVDLLVVMKTDLTPRAQRLQIARTISPRPFGLDILVRTPTDLERRIALGDFFLREVVKKGKAIYERSH